MLANLLAAVVLIGLIAVGSLKMLGVITHHGQEYEVPSLDGMNMDEAAIVAKTAHMSVEVAETQYDKSKPLGIILEQIPAAGSHAKRGRVIYVVMNSHEVPEVTLPEVREKSIRQACAALEAIGLEVSEIVYEVSRYKDLVLDVRLGHKSLEAGTKVKQGTKLTLIVAGGVGTKMIVMPNVIGMPLREVEEYLDGYNLWLEAVVYMHELEEGETGEYRVFEQSVEPDEPVLEGSLIGVRVATSEDAYKEAKKRMKEEDAALYGSAEDELVVDFDE